MSSSGTSISLMVISGNSSSSGPSSSGSSSSGSSSSGSSSPISPSSTSSSMSSSSASSSSGSSSSSSDSSPPPPSSSASSSSTSSSSGSSSSGSSPPSSSSSASSFSASFSGSSSRTSASSCIGAKGDPMPCGDCGSFPASDTLLCFRGFYMKSTNRASSSTSENFVASARTERLSFSGVCACTGVVKGVSSASVLVVFLFEYGAFSSVDFSDHFLFALVQEGLLSSFLLGPLLVLAGSSISFLAVVSLCSCFNNTSHVMPLASSCFRTRSFIRSQ